MTLPPLLATTGRVTDGGLETDLIFHHGVDLPEFASYPLVQTPRGRGLLRRYYAAYARIARAAGRPLLLEAPTWRANPDWGARLGHDARHLGAVNRQAIAFLRHLAADFEVHDTLVAGMVGPRGDGYRRDADIDPDEAERYHRPQVEAFADAGADVVTAYTLTDPGEAIGISRACRGAGLDVVVSFTVETDGRLPGGMPLGEAINRVDDDCAPVGFGINCAHPRHMLTGLHEARSAGPSAWRERVVVLRSNASAASHAELDESETLDDGDPDSFAVEHALLWECLPGLVVRGGCCGTDARHVANLWGVPHQDLASTR